MIYLHNDDIHNWLWEALVMEEQCEELFDGQADQLRHYPHIQSKLEKEAISARVNQKILLIRLQQLGIDTSIFKDDFEGLIQVSPTLFKMCMSNNVQEGIFALYTLAQMEINSFKIIEKAAGILNDAETRDISKTILDQLTARAQWMSSAIMELTHEISTSQAA